MMDNLLLARTEAESVIHALASLPFAPDVWGTEAATGYLTRRLLSAPWLAEVALVGLGGNGAKYLAVGKTTTGLYVDQAVNGTLQRRGVAVPAAGSSNVTRTPAGATELGAYAASGRPWATALTESSGYSRPFVSDAIDGLLMAFAASPAALGNSTASSFPPLTVVASVLLDSTAAALSASRGPKPNTLPGLPTAPGTGASSEVFVVDLRAPGGIVLAASSNPVGFLQRSQSGDVSPTAPLLVSSAGNAFIPAAWACLAASFPGIEGPGAALPAAGIARCSRGRLGGGVAVAFTLELDLPGGAGTGGALVTVATVDYEGFLGSHKKALWTFSVVSGLALMLVIVFNLLVGNCVAQPLDTLAGLLGHVHPLYPAHLPKTSVVSEVAKVQRILSVTPGVEIDIAQPLPPV